MLASPCRTAVPTVQTASTKARITSAVHIHRDGRGNGPGPTASGDADAPDPRSAEAADLRSSVRADRHRSAVPVRVAPAAPPMRSVSQAPRSATSLPVPRAATSSAYIAGMTRARGPPTAAAGLAVAGDDPGPVPSLASGRSVDHSPQETS
ncbi:hypothetical protein GCM10010350_31100 [Streptomyces galilaeus]|nr:hypothetical protein GCM10010350_31100 [Streptomyces galilaeus]